MADSTEPNAPVAELTPKFRASNAIMNGQKVLVFTVPASTSANANILPKMLTQASLSRANILKKPEATKTLGIPKTVPQQELPGPSVPNNGAAVKKEPNTRVKWDKEDLLYMAEYFADNKEVFVSGNTAYAWEKPAEHLAEKKGNPGFTPTVCRNKWCDMKTQYKNERERRNTSGMGAVGGNPTEDNKGNKRGTMDPEVYSALHDILYDVPEVSPKALCSTGKTGSKAKKDDDEKSPAEKKTKLSLLEKYKQVKIEQRDRHHNEKMDLIRSFVDDTKEFRANIASSLGGKSEKGE